MFYRVTFEREIIVEADSDKNPLMNYIDWTAWAEDLKADYTEVSFEGRDYLIRA